MKIYLVYAKIDIDLWEKKIKNYIRQTETSYGKFSYDENTMSYIGLYAWTHKKKILNMFKESRFLAFSKGMYTVKQIKVCRDDFLDFLKCNKDKEIVLRDLQTKKSEKHAFKDKANDYYVHTILTNYEYEVCSDDSFARVEIFENLHDKLRVDYYAFNDLFKALLEVVGYGSEFDINIMDYDCDDYNAYNEYYEYRSNLAYYNGSFNMSSSGFPIKYDLYGDRYTLFQNIYFEMIVGYKSGSYIHDI